MRTPWKKRQDLQRAVSDRALREFKKIFGREPDNTWIKKVRARYDRLLEKDKVARKALYSARWAPDELRAFLREHGLDRYWFGAKNARPIPAFLQVLGQAAHRLTDKDLRSLKVEDVRDSEGYYVPSVTDIRSFVLEHFLELSVPPPELYVPPGERRILWGPKHQRPGWRVLGDLELACIKIVLAPEETAIFAGDCWNGTPAYVVLRRETRRMTRARERLQAHYTREKAPNPKQSDPGLPWLPFEDTPASSAQGDEKSGFDLLDLEYGPTREPRRRPPRPIKRGSTPSGRRSRRRPPTVPPPTTDQKAKLKAMIAGGACTALEKKRAQAWLWLAGGKKFAEVAQRLGVTERVVFKWRPRFQPGPPVETLLSDAPRSGRPRAKRRAHLHCNSSSRRPRPAVAGKHERTFDPTRPDVDSAAAVVRESKARGRHLPLAVNEGF
jgi:Homeodomain-like domain-containing protein